MKSRNWTRDETIIALSVYCRIPFKSSSKTNSEVIKYAKIIGRSPSALNMKIGNFGRLDPTLRVRGIVGLANGSKLDEEIWNEFSHDWSKLAYESSLLVAKIKGSTLEESLGIDSATIPRGVERERTVRARVNHSFFRSAVLSAYNSSCCITGLNIAELLIASHIKPWSVDENNRLDPQNGLCLNVLHDKAFDRGLITISSDFHIINSGRLQENYTNIATSEFFERYNGVKIKLPDRFTPGKEFLAFHRENIFQN